MKINVQLISLLITLIVLSSFVFHFFHKDEVLLAWSREQKESIGRTNLVLCAILPRIPLGFEAQVSGNFKCRLYFLEQDGKMLSFEYTAGLSYCSEGALLPFQPRGRYRKCPFRFIAPQGRDAKYHRSAQVILKTIEKGCVSIQPMGRKNTQDILNQNIKKKNFVINLQ